MLREDRRGSLHPIDRTRADVIDGELLFLVVAETSLLEITKGLGEIGERGAPGCSLVAGEDMIDGDRVKPPVLLEPRGDCQVTRGNDVRYFLRLDEVHEGHVSTIEVDVIEHLNLGRVNLALRLLRRVCSCRGALLRFGLVGFNGVFDNARAFVDRPVCRGVDRLRSPIAADYDALARRGLTQRAGDRLDNPREVSIVDVGLQHHEPDSRRAFG